VIKMQFLCDIRVRHEGMTFDELWDRWEAEAETALPFIEAGALHAWKVVGQRRVIAVVEAESHDDLDRLLMGALPMAHVLDLAEIAPVRPYEAFAADVKARWKVEQHA
jgi:muconolactone D-isomerase